ncbi:type II toxin-antitoxin system VapC family toxin [Pleurocapsales cyanobacterium LEGE 06147]|nr:type II toxin-antitoxin system VapC family toxin [Pleurocapsales cyanobacterium LEGE 06147]
MSSFVLDASALLAYLRDEAGAIVVEKALDRGAAISIVNWIEVLSKVAEVGGEPEELVSQLENLSITGNCLEIVPLLEDDAISIAKLRPATRTLDLSLGDRSCLALGMKWRLPILTAAQIWVNLNLDAEIQLLR